MRNMIYHSVLDMVGNTPIMQLHRFNEGAAEPIYAKLERCNPGGSAKDRVGVMMLQRAKERGQIQPGAVIVEATSGNTGIGLAIAARQMGYRLVLTMPASMSVERRRLLAALGAELVLTPPEKGMSGATEKAEEILKNNPGSFAPGQFENEDNVAAHEMATGPEILRDMEGKVDVLVATVGTGGTLMGCAKAIRAMCPNVHVVAVEPAESPLLSQGKAGSHGIQGIGANFVPGIYDAALVDEVVTVSTQQALEAARRLMTSEGLLCGISSGAALAAAESLQRREEFAGKRIVTILPDTGERYLSTDLFGEE